MVKKSLLESQFLENTDAIKIIKIVIYQTVLKGDVVLLILENNIWS